MQVGRAGRGTETLWQVPEVRNLLRHLNHRNFMLRRYRIPWPWPRNGGEPVGSQEKAVGSSRGGNGDVLGIWQGRRQPGSLGESGLGPARPFFLSEFCSPAPGCGAGGGAGRTDVLSVMGVKEHQERRGPSERSVLQNQRTAKSPRPETLVLVPRAPFRRGAKRFTNRLRCGFKADNQQLRSPLVHPL